jgi:hypothetical protein
MRYHFRCVGTYTTSVVTTGPKVGLTTPAAPTLLAAQAVIYGLTASTATMGVITATGGSVVGADVAVINTPYVFVVEGFLVPSVNGFLQIQYASETAALTTLKAGAKLEVFQG